jgi:hypothetical protein
MKFIKTFESFQTTTMNPAEFSKPANSQPTAIMYTVLRITPDNKLVVVEKDYNVILSKIEELYDNLLNNETEYPTMPQDFKTIEDQVVYALCIMDKLEFFTSEDGSKIFLNDREKVDLTYNEFTNLVLSMYELA